MKLALPATSLRATFGFTGAFRLEFNESPPTLISFFSLCWSRRFAKSSFCPASLWPSLLLWEEASSRENRLFKLLVALGLRLGVTEEDFGLNLPGLSEATYVWSSFTLGFAAAWVLIEIRGLTGALAGAVEEAPTRGFTGREVRVTGLAAYWGFLGTNLLLVFSLLLALEVALASGLAGGAGTTDFLFAGTYAPGLAADAGASEVLFAGGALLPVLLATPPPVALCPSSSLFFLYWSRSFVTFSVYSSNYWILRSFFLMINVSLRISENWLLTFCCRIFYYSSSDSLAVFSAIHFISFFMDATIGSPRLDSDYSALAFCESASTMPSSYSFRLFCIIGKIDIIIID